MDSGLGACGHEDQGGPDRLRAIRAVGSVSLRSRSDGGSAASLVLANSQAKKALDILDSNGIALSSSVRTDIEAAMNASDAGDEREQCCCAAVVWLLYFVRMPEPDEVTWYNHQFNAGGGREGGRVEVTKAPSYIKF